MGADMRFVEEYVDKANGELAEDIIDRIITVMEDDNPFKEQRVERLVAEYKAKREFV